MDKSSYVYMLASRPYGTLYIGVTSDLIKRIWQHREAASASFTRTYHVHRLVWYEIHTDIRAAITREKQLKTWNRDWKIKLVQASTPAWHDLCTEVRA